MASLNRDFRTLSDTVAVPFCLWFVDIICVLPIALLSHMFSQAPTQSQGRPCHLKVRVHSLRTTSARHGQSKSDAC